MAARPRVSSPYEKFLFSVGDLTLSTLFFAPTQRVRFLMTVQGELLRRKRLDTPYKNPYDCFKRLVAQEGVFSLWRGTLFDSNLLSVAQVAIHHLLSLGVISIANTWTVGPSAGLLAEIVASSAQVILYPISYVHHRLCCDVKSASQDYEFKGPADVIRRTYNEEGVSGFYSGVVPFVLCNIAYRFAFEYGQQLFLDNEASTKGYMLAGGFALVVAGVLTYPLDLVRRRVILNPLAPPELKYRNWIDCTKRIYKEEGPLAFYDGLLSTVILSAAAQLPPIALAMFIRRTYS